MDNNLRIIELHYELFQSERHSMDAMSFNTAEFNLIRALKSINNFIPGIVKVEIEAKREGSIIDILHVIITDPILQHVVDVLLGALMTIWFRPQISKTEEINNRLEIVKKIKSGEFTQSEVEPILAGDKQLVKWCSDYFSSIQSSKEVSQITSTIVNETSDIETGTIGYKDFEKKIIRTEETTKTETIEGCTIHIVSPVLVKMDRNQLWKGIYSNRPIEFKIEDDEFLKQVYNQEIKFGNGTYITCSLSISTTIKRKDDGEDTTKQVYIVKEVSHWADDEHFQYFTKRYKRQLNEGKTKQLSLFEEDEISPS